jgi:hypothetical protein
MFDARGDGDVFAGWAGLGKMKKINCYKNQ